MLSSTSEYKDAVYAQERQFLARASIKMDAFTDVEPKVIDSVIDMNGKVVGDTLTVPHIGKYTRSSLLRKPSDAAFAENTQSVYNALYTDDTSYYHFTGTTAGTMIQAMFSFNLIEYFERTYGSVVWGGATTTAEKVALLKKYITSMYGTFIGYGNAPVRPVFKNFRYIRDWLKGSTANANNYWNEIQCLAGATNRALGKTPTISSGTLTNSANIQDGNTATYGYEASGNGVAKYIQIDLGAVYTDIDTIKVHHYYLDGRTFHGTKTEISLDGYNWYPIFDSAVSGEYVETSAGRTYTSSTGGYHTYFTIWDESKANWASEVSHTATTPTALSRTGTVVPNVITPDGWVHFLAWADPTDGVTSYDLYCDYIKLNITGAFTDIRVFDDNDIIRFSSIEEMTTLNDTLPSNELTITLDNSNGDLDLVSFANMQKVIASKPEITLELGLVTSHLGEVPLPDYAVEWTPMGTYFLTDWKNDVTSRIISLTAHDYFMNLGDISYNPTATTNLGVLAQEVLAAGGVPASKWFIDASLYNISVNKFPERIDCRTALQHIGIAGRSAVFQDRYGNINIRPFRTIDEETNYVVYPTTQPSLYGYIGPSTYPLNSTAGGMKYLDFEQMYDAPQVSLEKSIYQLVIKIYNIVNEDGTLDASEQVYTNAALEGLNGESFTIDNPLVNTIDMADKICSWYMREINYNAIYSATWRQNPVLECADIILVEDSFGTEKQTRIIRNQFDYEGYLSGITESRGGV